MRGQTRPWTPDEVKGLVSMRRGGMTAAAIAQLIGRSLGSVTGKLEYLGLSKAQREARSTNLRKRRHVETSTQTTRIHFNKQDTPAKRPPPDILIDRDRRLSIKPRDLTAEFCGDPLPGYSALERRV